MQLAPLLLILILLALGAYALLTLRDNQLKLDALMAGPVRQAELAADLNSTIQNLNLLLCPSGLNYLHARQFFLRV